jgi:hypothetical protein
MTVATQKASLDFALRQSQAYESMSSEDRAAFRDAGLSQVFFPTGDRGLAERLTAEWQGFTTAGMDDDDLRAAISCRLTERVPESPSVVYNRDIRTPNGLPIVVLPPKAGALSGLDLPVEYDPDAYTDVKYVWILHEWVCIEGYRLMVQSMNGTQIVLRPFQVALPGQPGVYADVWAEIRVQDAG